MDDDTHPLKGTELCEACRSVCFFGIEAAADCARFCWECGIGRDIIGRLWGENPTEGDNG